MEKNEIKIVVPNLHNTDTLSVGLTEVNDKENKGLLFEPPLKPDTDKIVGEEE